jgi:heptosyltransferase-2
VWETKQLPAKTWANLLQLLSKEKPDCALYLLGGPYDEALIAGIIDMAGVGTNLAGKLSLAGSTALLAGATRLYANDSGPVHLASAVGCPTTAIFCSTVPAFGFGPLAQGSVVVQETIGLPCRPCGLHGKRTCPQSHFLCGKVLSAKEILAAEAKG